MAIERDRLRKSILDLEATLNTKIVPELTFSQIATVGAICFVAHVGLEIAAAIDRICEKLPVK